MNSVGVDFRVSEDSEPSLIWSLSVSLEEQVMRDGFPQAVAVGLGLVAAFGLAFFTIVVFGGFP